MLPPFALAVTGPPSPLAGCDRQNRPKRSRCVLDEVPVLAVLPRIEFNAEARVEAAESQRAAGLPEGIRSDVLKNEHHAVGPGRIERAKVHGEIQVKRLRQVDEIRIPYRAVLIALRGGQLIAIATQRLSGAV